MGGRTPRLPTARRHRIGRENRARGVDTFWKFEMKRRNVRTTRQPPEQCDFKENGLVKVCVGTVTLDQDNGSYDVVCEEIKDVILGAENLGERIKNAKKKVWEKIKSFGRRIKEFFRKPSPEVEP
ncbi:Cathelicidin antimicrobial peptide [Myotis davidii]|uniref:Cathelicidin antimicrobial peptide n=1 Tax=Myotis davidii TaxID=225400 RepID=L5LH90_MYODS|nr:Cathelicidin antimicrobial peptide [Myotis davidii]